LGLPSQRANHVFFLFTLFHNALYGMNSRIIAN
jgi:hypothetical protein